MERIEGVFGVELGRLNGTVVSHFETFGGDTPIVNNQSFGAARIGSPPPLVRSCYDSQCLTDIKKSGFDSPVVNRKRLRSNNVRSCLASLENALKACVDAVIASTLAFVPDLL
ncbi:hypothetical protein PQR68_13160 [Paraburkholderia agricolaris]|uniref:hypothetical protein n=1 Tax=Paraburkholderia agricolaris TaxID=2152888 RepID=UPI0012924559|nr:hypothetical protein [Paraburkholderia agricolaris]